MQRLAKETQRWAKEEAKAAEKAEKEKTKAVEKAAKEKIAIWKQMDREEAQARKEALREFERDERKKTKEAEKWLKKREREELASIRRSAEQRRQLFGALGSATARGLSAGVRSTAGVTMGLVGKAMSVGGGFDIADSVRRATAASGKAADIANSGYLPQGNNLANRTRRSSSEILAAASGAATQYGISQDESLEGLQKFVGLSGDLSQGMKLLPQMAQLARATGSSLDDIAEAAGNVSLNLGDMDKDGSKTMSVLRGLSAQGQLGAVEMRDLAKQISKISAASGKFDGDAADNMLKMGALAQEARGEGGAFSASVAANAVSGFATTLKTGARVQAFAERGIDVYSDKSKTKFRSPDELIVEALKKTGGNQLQMNALFKNVMGDRAVAGFAKRFVDAGGGEKGEAAVRARFQELYKGSTLSQKDVDERAAQRMEEDDAKMARTMAEFDRAVATQLVPKLRDMIPVIEKLIPQFVDLSAMAIPVFVDLVKTIAKFAEENKGTIAWFASHPIGTLIAGHIAADLGQAAIGETVKRLLVSAFPGGGSGAGAGIPKPSAPSGMASGLSLGSRLPAAGALIALGTSGYSTGFDAGDAVNAKAGSDTKSAISLAQKIRSGQASPEEIAQGKKRLASLQNMMASAKGVTTDSGASKAVWALRAGAEGFLNNFGIGDTSRQDHVRANAKAEATQANSFAFETAITQLQKALEANTQAMNSGGGGKADPNHPSRSMPQAGRDPSAK